MRFLYVSSSKISSRDANSVHVMRTCDALAEQGHEVTLLTAHLGEPRRRVRRLVPRAFRGRPLSG